MKNTPQMMIIGPLRSFLPVFMHLLHINAGYLIQTLAARGMKLMATPHHFKSRPAFVPISINITFKPMFFW